MRQIQFYELKYNWDLTIKSIIYLVETQDYYIYVDLFSEFKPTCSNIIYFNQNAKKSMRNSDSNLKVAEKDIHEKIADI